MNSSFFKNLGPIRYSVIKEHFESIPININEDTLFNEFTSVKNLKVTVQLSVVNLCIKNLEMTTLLL